MSNTPRLTPGDYIRKELEDRGWMQRDLAFMLGVPEQAINYLVSGKRGISADMARLLSVAFGNPPEFFLKLQKEHEISHELLHAKEPNPGVVRMVKLQSSYPLREMIKRGWIDPDPATVETQLAHFFGVASAEDVPHMAHAARKTNYDDIPPPVQLAWLYRVRQVASEMVVPQYSEKKLRETIPKLSALMIEPEEARHVSRMLLECGIRFVLVESLPSAKIDGVCCWIKNGASPIIGLSMRFDRIDNFWFVLRHELEHVLRRDGLVAAVIDDLDGENANSAGVALSEAELAANAAASDFCVSKTEMDSWIARKHPYYSERDLLGFAKRIGIHPGIVAGQLRSRTNNYKIFGKYLAKIRFAVESTALTDGWGQVAPVLNQREGVR